LPGARRLAFIARVVYGARNGFAPLASALEDAGLSPRHVRLVLVEEDPLPAASRLEGEGYTPVILYGVSSPAYLELREEIRRVARRYRVVAGGPHAEGAYWHLLRDGAYAAVVGDGEPAIVGLAEHLLGWRGIEEVPNIAVYRDGRFLVTRIVNVGLDDYRPHNPTHHLYPPIEIMRGCHYKCKFCQVPWLFKAQYRYRSVPAIARAVQDYVSTGRRRIRFVAPIGLAYGSHQPGKPNPTALEELLSTVRRLGGEPYLGSFPSETRPEYVTPETLSIIKRLAANKRISIGLQSGSNRLLQHVGRGHTVEQALQAVEETIEHGLIPVVDIIFSLPGETSEDVLETITVMKTLAEKQARLRLHTFLPLPGTPLARTPPKPVHPAYKKTTLHLLGKGVLETGKPRKN